MRLYMFPSLSPPLYVCCFFLTIYDVCLRKTEVFDDCALLGGFIFTAIRHVLQGVG